MRMSVVTMSLTSTSASVNTVFDDVISGQHGVDLVVMGHGMGRSRSNEDSNNGDAPDVDTVTSQLVLFTVMTGDKIRRLLVFYSLKN